MAHPEATGLLDLENELTCSICTEILYQPLTLLDCLHTFCGSCLKEWFSFEATQASSAKPYPYTCPSCRAAVRDTRPNAAVTTLLEMFLKVNPSRGRTAGEKAVLGAKYTQGEKVMPKVHVSRGNVEDARDQRMVQEAMARSMRDAGIRDSAEDERATRHHIRGTRGTGHHSIQQTATAGLENRARQIEHQPSLRSLLSNSDVDSSGLEEEILRQILEDGILDGVDFHNLDVAQEDELSERIAEAYRRRHQHRSRSRDRESRRRSHQRQRSSREASREQVSVQEPRSPRRVQTDHHTSRPPISRPHLFETAPSSPQRSRRASSETRSQASSNRSTQSLSAQTSPRQAARSATDLSIREIRTPPERPAGRSATDLAVRSRREVRNSPERTTTTQTGRRRRTDPNRVSVHQRSDSAGPQSSRHVQGDPQSGDRGQSPSTARPGHNESTSTNPTAVAVSNDFEDGIAELGPSERQIVPPERAELAGDAELSSVRSPVLATAVPVVSCNKCGRSNLEYQVHYHCDECEGGNYDLCVRCYRAGRGCFHWFGFGHRGLAQYDRQNAGNNLPPPHRLKARRYRMEFTVGGSGIRSGATGNPQVDSADSRLEKSAICSNCGKFSPNCMWICDICNDGEWAFCQECVSRGRRCTHPLSPVGFRSSYSDTVSGRQISSAVTAMPYPLPTQYSVPGAEVESMELLKLVVNFTCAICTQSIPTFARQYHCAECKDGDFYVHTACYTRLVETGKILAHDGPNGWRRCPTGHRMTLEGFRDTNPGQLRMVIRDLVGGYIWKHAQTATPSSNVREFTWKDQGQKVKRTLEPDSFNETSKINEPGGVPIAASKPLPPDGGSGMDMRALYSYWGDENAKDELTFPRGAELRQCRDINGDWCEGVYCGRAGFIPTPFVEVLRTV